jgi:hypothetical protein
MKLNLFLAELAFQPGRDRLGLAAHFAATGAWAAS